jgi:outer membrane receptor protein involved in Fe transport
MHNRETVEKHARGALGRFAGSSVFVIALALGQGVSAQTLAAEPAASPSDIIVTGSRLTRSGFNAPTPVTVISADQLQTAAPASLSDALNQLPEFRNSLTVASTGPLSTAAGGGAFLNLRGLSAKRNLVLLDGKRLPPTTVTGLVAGATDLNVLPQALVARVDVVTGGASAAYGSDAVSGVINFVLDKKFTGLKGTFQGGISSRGDNQSLRGALAYGSSFAEDRGHILASLEYIDSRGIKDSSDRGWAKRGFAMIRTLAPLPQTSTDNPTRVIAPDVRPANASTGGLITSGPLAGNQFVGGGGIQPFPYGTLRTATTMSGGGTDPDFGVMFSALPPQKRGTAFLHVSYDVAPDWTAYVEGQYGVSTSRYRGLLSSFATHQAYTIFRDNAYLPDAVRTALGATPSFTLGRIDQDWGFHQEYSKYDLRRGVVGVDGKIGGWSVNAYYTHGESRHDTRSEGNANLVRLFDAVDAVVVPAGTAGLTAGSIVCRTTLTNPGNGCVPLNVLGPNSATPQALAYVLGAPVQHQVIKQDVADIAISGEPFSLWAGPVSVGIGATWRREAAVSVSDATSESYNPAVPGTPAFKPGLTPILSGNINRFPAALRGQRGGWETGNPGGLSGHYSVREVFGEILVPLAKDWALAKSLELNAAVRYADYSTSGGVTSWKAGLTYEPFSGLRARATRSRDVRAANLAELFQGVSQANPAIVDPFRGSESNSTVITRNFGNPKLMPEQGDTLTAGLVYQPRWLPGFSASADYYNIKISDTIAQLSGQVIVDQCYAGVATLCGLITRDTGMGGGVGPMIAVDNPFLNAGLSRTRGIDFELAYRSSLAPLIPSSSGNVTFRLLANHLIELSTFVTGARSVTEAAGRVGALLPAGSGGGAKWGGTFNVTYENGPFSLFLQERYIGPGVIDATVDSRGNPISPTSPTNANLTGNGLVPNRIGAVWYSDATVSYKFAQNKLEAFLTVNNLFDRDPPVIPTYFFYGTIATNYQIYDVIGRTFTAGVRFRF